MRPLYHLGLKVLCADFTGPFASKLAHIWNAERARSRKGHLSQQKNLDHAPLFKSLVK